MKNEYALRRYLTGKKETLLPSSDGNIEILYIG